MDPSAPLTVAKGALITSAITGTFTGLFEVLRVSPNSALLATSAAINGGVVGATFFGFREYIVSPSLTSLLWDTSYTYRLRAAHNSRAAGPQTGQRLSYWDMRLHNVPDTLVSGAFTGALFNAWTHGRKAIVRGTFGMSMACTILQLAYNELGIVRIKYISQRVDEPNSEPEKPFRERAFLWFGLKPLQDEEYIKVLKRQREGYLRRIEELEQQREVLEKPLKPHSQSSSSTDI